MNPYQKLVDYLAPTRLGGTIFRRLATVVDRRLLRWSKGRFSSGIGTSYGKRILLLTVRGRKSGQLRTVPLLYTPNGDDTFIVVASKAGEPDHPAWYLNVRESPEVTIDVGGRRLEMHAHESEGDERKALFEKASANYPGYTVYQARVDRQIPVILLRPRSPRPE
jgi:deazaflavin-dependent oxidoreductase (nitroreductase family)